MTSCARCVSVRGSHDRRSCSLSSDRLGNSPCDVGVEFPISESRHLNVEERPDVCCRLFRTSGDSADNIFTPFSSSHYLQEGVHRATPVARFVALDRRGHGFDQLLAAWNRQQRQLQENQ